MIRQRVPVLDVEVTPLKVGGVTDALDRAIRDQKSHSVAGHNLHSVTLYHGGGEFARFYDQADLVLMDGAPVAKLWARSAGESAGEYRLGSIDWLARIGDVEQLSRLAVIGSSVEANAKAVAVLQSRIPEATVVGLPGSGWDAARQQEALSWLREQDPQLVLLGLGMPLQEQVITDFLQDFPGRIYAAVGGAIDQLAGTQKLAPRWVGRMGGEWAWRLFFDPRRVAYRVFVEPWKLGSLLLRRRLSTKKKG